MSTKQFTFFTLLLTWTLPSICYGQLAVVAKNCWSYHHSSRKKYEIINKDFVIEVKGQSQSLVLFYLGDTKLVLPKKCLQEGSLASGDKQADNQRSLAGAGAREIEAATVETESSRVGRVFPKAFLKNRINYKIDDQAFLRFLRGTELPMKFFWYGVPTISPSSESQKPFDFSQFSSKEFLFTPTYYGFGLVAELQISTGENNNVFRTGLSHSSFGKFGPLSCLTITSLTVYQNSGDGGQMLNIFGCKFGTSDFSYQGEIFLNYDGSEFSTISYEPRFYYHTSKTIKFYTGINYLKTLSETETKFSIGLELSAF